MYVTKTKIKLKGQKSPKYFNELIICQYINIGGLIFVPFLFLIFSVYLVSLFVIQQTFFDFP